MRKCTRSTRLPLDEISLKVDISQDAGNERGLPGVRLNSLAQPQKYVAAGVDVG